MNLLDFQQQVKRTMPDLGTKLLNSVHMTLGMGSELSEWIEAAINGDKVNEAEETADFLWYLMNYFTLHNISINMNRPDSSLSSIETLTRLTGALQDMDKKELAYGQAPNEEMRYVNANLLLEYVEIFARLRNVSIADACRKVVNKLMLRYPDKFDADKAINRDTTAERQILEQ